MGMKKQVLALSLSVLIAGCAVKMDPLTAEQNLMFANEKLARATANQEPVTGSITLYDAMARALKYNLDTKVEIMEAALKIRNVELASYNMLPNLVAASGYAGRNDADSSTPSTRDTDILSSDLTFSWNILDFGLSYVRAKQAADEALIQQEMKRKIVNRVIEDVRTAYWRAVSYERLVGRMRGLEGRVSRALRDTKQLATGEESSPLVALTYERELIQVKREVEMLEGELKVAKSQLAALMNVEPGSNFSLALPKRRGTKLGLPNDLHGLFAIAASNRPEMREVAYRMRINDKEVDAAMLELLPNFNIYAGVNYDSNKFIAANDWISWGSKVSWNLLKLTSTPALMKKVDAQKAALDARALSVAMAVMTQVHISRVRYGHLQKSYSTASALSNVSHRLLTQVRSETAAQRTSEQILIREEMNTLLADAKLDMAYADLQNAYANVYASLGLDPFPAGLSTDAPVSTISAQLKDMWIERGEKGTLVVAGVK
ncbi:outer membrane protein [Phyllobacterium sp. YR531]|nr:outer membrane protein [Phyllobacterium sp. YR531]